MEGLGPQKATRSLSKGRRWAALAILSLSLLVIVMDITILNVALPSITSELRPTNEELLWMVDAYSLALAGLLITMTGVGDRFGRKRILIIGFLLFGAGSAFVLFASSAGFIIALRVVLGVGAAMIMPTTLSLLRTIFPDPKERASAIAIWAAVSALGVALGPLVGGFLLEHLSWHAAFLVNVPFMIIAIIGALLLLPEVKVEGKKNWDYLGIALSIAGMSLLPWSIKRLAQEMTLSDPVAWVGLALSFICLIIFVHRCLHRSDPLLDVRLFTRRAFLGGVLAALGSMFALAAMGYLLAQWMQLVHNYSPMETGIRMLPFAVAGLTSSLISPLMARKFGPRPTIAVGLLIAAFGILFIWINGSHLEFYHVVITMVCIGAGEGALTVGSTMIMADSPPSKAGSAAAIDEISYDFGNVLGVSIVGSIAGLAYKAYLEGGVVSSLAPGLADSARESLGSAIESAQQLGLPELATQARDAFNHSLSDASLVGGILLCLVALITFIVIPKHATIDEQTGYEKEG